MNNTLYTNPPDTVNRVGILTDKSMEGGRGNMYYTSGTFFAQPSMEAHGGIHTLGITRFQSPPTYTVSRLRFKSENARQSKSFADVIASDNDTEETEEEDIFPEGYGTVKPMFLRERDFRRGDPYRFGWMDRFDIFESILKRGIVFDHVIGCQKTSNRT